MDGPKNLSPDGINEYLGTLGPGLVAEPVEGGQYDTDFVQSMDASLAIASAISGKKDPDVERLIAELSESAQEFKTTWWRHFGNAILPFLMKRP